MSDERERVARSRGAGSLHPWVCRFTIIISFVTLSSSTIDSSTALIVWVNGCGGTDSNSMRRRPSLFGWNQFFVLPRVPSARLSSGEELSSHHSLFVIWASSSIQPSVSLTTSPGLQGLAISSFDNFDSKITDHWVLPFEDHWPLSPAILYCPCSCDGPIAFGLLQQST